MGKKTAERLVLELKEKVNALHLEQVAAQAKPATPVSGHLADLISALVNLGYKQPQAEKAAQSASERLGDEAAFQALFREALKVLRAGA